MLICYFVFDAGAPDFGIGLRPCLQVLFQPLETIRLFVGDEFLQLFRWDVCLFDSRCLFDPWIWIAEDFVVYVLVVVAIFVFLQLPFNLTMRRDKTYVIGLDFAFNKLLATFFSICTSSSSPGPCHNLKLRGLFLILPPFLFFHVAKSTCSSFFPCVLQFLL